MTLDPRKSPAPPSPAPPTAAREAVAKDDQASADQARPANRQAPSLDATLAAAASGDGEAWRQLIDEYSPRVYGLILRQCGDRELSEEIAQATFVKVVTHLDRYNEQGRFEPWLFRIAMNRLRDEMRRRKRQARPMDMSPGSAPGGSGGGKSGAGSGGGTSGGGGSGGGTSGGGTSGGGWAAVQDRIVDDALTDGCTPLDRMTQAEQIDLLKRAIATMSEADQQIIFLRHTAGLSFAQIAETLEAPLGTVLARGHRALGKLKKIMLGDDADHEPSTMTNTTRTNRETD